MGSFRTDSEKHGDALRFGFRGDSRNSRSASSYKLMQSMGRMYMDSDYAKYFDYYDTDGFWQKTNLDIYHIQRLSNRVNLHASLLAQYAWHNLDSSEKFYIGGYNAVRAFPQGGKRRRPWPAGFTGAALSERQPALSACCLL